LGIICSLLSTLTVPVSGLSADVLVVVPDVARDVVVVSEVVLVDVDVVVDVDVEVEVDELVVGELVVGAVVPAASASLSLPPPQPATSASENSAALDTIPHRHRCTLCIRSQTIGASSIFNMSPLLRRDPDGGAPMDRSTLLRCSRTYRSSSPWR
jgi:hypothetical protein